MLIVAQEFLDQDTGTDTEELIILMFTLDFRKNENYWILLLIIISHVSCVQDDEFSIPEITCDDPNLTATKSVDDMMKASGSSASKYLEDDVLIGYVVSSDEGGNIYKNILLLMIVERGLTYLLTDTIIIPHTNLEERST